MQNIISKRASASDQRVDISIENSMQHIFFKERAIDLSSSPKVVANSRYMKNLREEKVNTKGRRHCLIATREVAVVWGTEHLVADGAVYVVALEGASVLAKQGSETIAMGGAKVCAGPGSRVIAMPGSQVFARKGSTIIMHFGAEIHRQFGVTVETVHSPDAKRKGRAVSARLETLKVAVSGT